MRNSIQLAKCTDGKHTAGLALVVCRANGRDDIVANDNSRGPTQNNPNGVIGGVHVFYAPDKAATGEWKSFLRCSG